MENAEGTIGFCSAWGCGGAPRLSGSWVGVPGAVPRPAGAQSWAAVTGTVVEAEGGTALVGAHVLLRSAASAEVVRQTATDACGDFAFDRVRPGRYVVKVQQLGYTPSARHALRASYNRSLAPPAAPLQLGTRFSPGLSPELQSITQTVEVGYRGTVWDGGWLDLAAYYAETKNVVATGQAEPLTYRRARRRPRRPLRPAPPAGGNPRSLRAGSAPNPHRQECARERAP